MGDKGEIEHFGEFPGSTHGGQERLEQDRGRARTRLSAGPGLLGGGRRLGG